jgi:hypothetical protein
MPYPEGPILVVEAGSTAHGTGLDGHEDHDEMVVFIEPAAEVLTGSQPDAFMQRTQPNDKRSGPGDTDRQVYSLRKFLMLASAGNPSVLMAFWAPVIRATPWGEALRAMGPAFVGRHVLPKYLGYMESQIARMKGEKGTAGHGHRGGGKREELVAAHGYDTKFAMHAARLGYQGYELVTTGRLQLPIQGEPGDWLRAVRRGKVPLDEYYHHVEGLEDMLRELRANTKYREHADTDAINDFAIKAHMAAWERERKSAESRGFRTGALAEL